MCGAVRFTLAEAPARFSACHCEMCRRWAGSAMLAFHVLPEAIRFSNEAQIRTLQSSDWAERAWCGRCGSGLYYRLTMEGAPGEYAIPVGLLDEGADLEFTHEIYADKALGCFSYAGDHPRRTRAETLAAWGIEDDAG